jgi:hypothetical protein
MLDEQPWFADLGGLEAAWAATVIADSMTLSRRSFDAINLATCFSTDVFAVGRMAALYGAKVAAKDGLTQIAELRAHFDKGTAKPSAAAGITDVLLSLLPGSNSSPSGTIDLLVRSCRFLHHSQASPEGFGLSESLLDEFSSRVKELSVLRHFQDLSAEDRVRLLRNMQSFNRLDGDLDGRRLFSFAAGYVLSGVGGAERDLRLAEAFGPLGADVLAWAATIGSLGATAYWTDAFGGLGRLVARELLRPLHTSDPPTADIAFDELKVIESQKPRSGRAFRPSSRSIAAVGLKPGIVVQIGIADDDRSRAGSVDSTAATRQADSKLGALGPEALHGIADQLRPYVRELVAQEMDKASNAGVRRTGRRGAAPQLPLKR